MLYCLNHSFPFPVVKWAEIGTGKFQPNLIAKQKTSTDLKLSFRTAAVLGSFQLKAIQSALSHNCNAKQTQQIIDTQHHRSCFQQV